MFLGPGEAQSFGEILTKNTDSWAPAQTYGNLHFPLSLHVLLQYSEVLKLMITQSCKNSRILTDLDYIMFNVSLDQRRMAVIVIENEHILVN